MHYNGNLMVKFQKILKKIIILVWFIWEIIKDMKK